MDGHNSIKLGFYYKQVVRASFARPLCKAALGGKKNTIGKKTMQKKESKYRCLAYHWYQWSTVPREVSSLKSIGLYLLRCYF